MKPLNSPPIGQKIVTPIDTLKLIADSMQLNSLQECFLLIFFFSCRQILEAKAALYDKMAQGEIEGRM